MSWQLIFKQYQHLNNINHGFNLNCQLNVQDYKYDINCEILKESLTIQYSGFLSFLVPLTFHQILILHQLSVVHAVEILMMTLTIFANIQ